MLHYLGLIYGLFLYKNPNKERKNISILIRLIIAGALITGLVNALLNSLWLSMMYGKAFIVLISTRIGTQLTLLPINIATNFTLIKLLQPFIKKYLYEEEEVSPEEYLNKFEQETKDPTLEAMYFLMEKFDNPHKRVKMIHVAGTNGKGSSVEMMTNILIKSGYKVGKYISPHLVRLSERVCVNNKEILDDEIKDILIQLDGYIKEYNKTHKIPVKWFEVTTSLAYIYFAKQKCDFAVIETGLGGTWDCTNIIEPEVSIICKIGYDHMRLLGNTIEEIARHKAGIIKENSNTVFFDEEGITRIIGETCKERNSEMHLIKEEDIENYRYDDNFQKIDYKEYKDIQIKLKGKAQTINAAECIEAASILKEKGYKITESSIKEGLRTVIHKARLEELSKKPLIIFDGGHNESAIINLRENIDIYYKEYENKVYIVSLLKSKDYKSIIKNLCENNNATFIFTNGIDKKRYVSNNDLYNEAKKYIKTDKLIKEELKTGIKLTKEKYLDSLNLVVGSFYIYKEVCEELVND